MIPLTFLKTFGIFKLSAVLNSHQMFSMPQVLKASKQLFQMTFNLSVTLNCIWICFFSSIVIISQLDIALCNFIEYIVDVDVDVDFG